LKIQDFYIKIKDFIQSRPAVCLVLAFGILNLIFAGLLCLPIATNKFGSAGFEVSFFTSSSAISGTGLLVVPTATYWSIFGKIILLLTMQVGGLGVMTMASMLGMIVSRHLGLTTKILTSNDIKGSKFGELGALLRIVLVTTFSIEFLITILLIPRFLELKENVLDAIWNAIFFAVSCFTNSGFDLSTQGLGTFTSQWSIAIPMIFGLEMGAIGFPVIRNLWECLRMRSLKKLSLNTKVTLLFSSVLNALIVVWFFAAEWGSKNLFGEKVFSNNSSHAADLLLQAWTTRASGFAIGDPSQLSESTKLLSEIWMFIGGAPASTCAGIKVTTVAILVYAVIAELRGREDITAFHKRFPSSSLRVAITIMIAGLSIVLLFTLVLNTMTPDSLEVVLFDTISAYANCGLTQGLATTLPAFGHFLMGILMILGRLGTMTVAAALMKRDRVHFIRYPEESIILG
jgi:Trk-type K+ transport system membrane component